MMVTAIRALSLWGVRPPVLLFVSLAASFVLAQPQDSETGLEGRTIGRIEFVPPRQPLPTAELERLLPFHPGSVLRRSEVRAAIEKLYRTGRFVDIAIE